MPTNSSNLNHTLKLKWSPCVSLYNAVILSLERYVHTAHDHFMNSEMIWKGNSTWTLDIDQNMLVYWTCNLEVDIMENIHREMMCYFQSCKVIHFQSELSIYGVQQWKMSFLMKIQIFIWSDCQIAQFHSQMNKRTWKWLYKKHFLHHKLWHCTSVDRSIRFYSLWFKHSIVILFIFFFLF